VTAVLLSYFFPPLKAPRAVQVERLARHSRLPMRVLCAAEGAVPPREGVEVMTFPYKSPRWWHLAKHLLVLPDPHRAWAMRVARQAATRGLVGRDDVLVSFGQPMSDHLAGLYLKRKLGMPWIAHFSDPWSDNPYLLPIPFARARLARMERAVIGAADRVLFTSAETVDLVMAKYPPAWRTKAAVLPHAHDPALYGDASRSAGGGPLLLRYLGNFYRQRNPLALARALALVQRRRPEVLEGVRVELIGRWVGHANWSPAALGLPESLLSLRSPVGYLDSLRLMREADALLIVDAPFEHNVFFPSKLVDYLGAGRPIVALTPAGTTADIVAAAGGLVASPASVESVAEGLAQALSRLRAGSLTAPGEEVVRRYAASRVAADFDALVRGVA
jgi:glycosyltransferase involved in cell wall biosynthesis